MKIPSALAAIRRLLAANGRFLVDPRFRSGVSHLLTLERAAGIDLPVGVGAAYRDLTPTSVALCDLPRDARTEPAVNLVLGGLSAQGLFAGIDTALRAALAASAALGRPCRVVTLESKSRRRLRELTAMLRARYSTESIEVVDATGVREFGISPRDVWMVTHFLTAHAAQVATEVGALAPDDVIYLVQDYEPGFVPWSTEYVLASASYHAGFELLVNSAPVAEALRRHEGIEVPRDRVFGPSFDLARLDAISEARARGEGPARIAFYGRPSKPRNLFGLGVAALRLATSDPGMPSAHFVSVGESHGDVPLGQGRTLKALGKLSWTGYFDFLAGVDVMLSLQFSPHPSHPPLEAALAGAWSVTNDFDGVRSGLHPRLLAVEPTPRAIAEAIRFAATSPAPVGRTVTLADLGGRLEDAVGAVVDRLSAS